MTDVHTEDYVTNDKLWLLSHEEVINIDVSFFRSNHECHVFEMFKTIDLEAYSRMLLELNMKKTFGWRLRSAGSYTTANDSKYVGCVDYTSHVNNYFVYYTSFGAIFPACTIC